MKERRAKMPKVGRKLLEWDEGQIIEDRVNDMLSNWRDYFDEEPAEELVRENVYNDTFLLEDEYDCLIMNLTEIIQRKNPKGYWRAAMENFGWRGTDGHNYLQAVDGTELLQGILPKTDCTFRIFNFGRGLAVQNFHHDSPVGKEWYYLKPMGERTFGKEYKHGRGK